MGGRRLAITLFLRQIQHAIEISYHLLSPVRCRDYQQKNWNLEA